MYEEFVKDFAADDGSVKTFVRGGTIDPGKSSGSAQGAGAGPPGRRSTSRHYVPSFIPPGMAAAMRGDKAKSEEVREPAPPPGPQRCAAPPRRRVLPSTPCASQCRPALPACCVQSVFQLPGANKGKPRSIDLLLENMKKCAHGSRGSNAGL